MNIFKHRPLSLFCAAFMLSFALFAAVLSSLRSALTVFFAAVALILLIIAIFAPKARRGAVLAIVCLIAVLIGIAYSYFGCERTLYKMEKEYGTRECTVSGYVLGTAHINSYSSSYYVMVESVNGEKSDFKARVDLDYVDYLYEGDRFEMTGQGVSFADDISGYPERKMMFAQGYSLAFEVTEGRLRILEGKVSTPAMFFERLNRRLCAEVSYRLPGAEGDLVNALLLGNRSGLEDSIRRDFTRSGVAHLLALSGLHTSIIIGFVELLLRKVRVPKTIRAIAILCAALFYLALTGFAASTVRAVLMMACVYLAFMFSANADGLTSLFASCMLILIMSPYSVFDAGFWMSFAATFGILVFSSPMVRTFKKAFDRMKTPKYLSKALIAITSSLAISLCATAFIVFFSMIYFGEISLAGPIATLILSPVTLVFLVVSMILLIFMRVPLIFTCAKFLLGALAELYVEITSYISSIRGVVVSLNYGFAVVLVTVFTLLLAVLTVINLKRRWTISLIPLGFIACFALAMAIHGAINGASISVDYMQHSKSESIVIYDTDKAMICDFSDGSYTSVALAVQDVGERCITEIEAVALTHYHKKHISSMKRLMNSSVVRALWLPMPQNEDDYYIFSALYDAADAAGVKAVVYEYLTPYTVFGTSSLMFSKDYISRSTHPVISMTLKNDYASITYLGASVNESKASENAFSLAKESDAVILGMHGPILKSKYEFALPSEENQLVLVANADMLEFIDTKGSQVFKISRAREKISFRKY